MNRRGEVEGSVIEHRRRSGRRSMEGSRKTQRRIKKILLLRTLHHGIVFTQHQLISINIFEKEKLNIILNLIKTVKALCDGPKL